MANVLSNGLPQNLYPESSPFIQLGQQSGIFRTSLLYQKYKDAFVLDSATGSVQISNYTTSESNWREILQLFQDIDTWAQLNPNDVTPTIQRISDTLMALRKASSTDEVYDAYELLLFWNMAVRPDYFSPLMVTAKTFVSTYIVLAKDYTYQVVYTRLYNDFQRAKNPNSPIKTPTEVYPNYTPPVTGNPANPDNPVTTTSKSMIWTVLAVLVVIVLLLLILK